MVCKNLPRLTTPTMSAIVGQSHSNGSMETAVYAELETSRIAKYRHREVYGSKKLSARFTSVRSPVVAK